MVHIIINGACGKMGRVLADVIAHSSNCEVTAGVDQKPESFSNFPVQSDFLGLSGDVIIDFSTASALESLLAFALASKTPAVIATTGYSQEQIKMIQQASKQIPVFFSFNMSLGINLLASLAKRAVAVLNNDFDIEIIEKHHNKKIDAPSGTATMLADALNEQANGRFEYVYDRHSQRQERGKNELGMHAVRGGTIVGEHEIIFAGRDEIITLSHSARSKEIFAVGAVNAAKFLASQQPGLYDMNDLIRQIQ